MVQVESLSPESYSLGRCQNISASGLLVLTPETFELHTEVTIRFSLPPAIAIQSKGLVVRVEPGVLMGIQFVGLQEEQRQAIARFVEHTATVRS
jgi:predicted Zn-dependent protease